jgi:hypothetical protein
MECKNSFNLLLKQGKYNAEFTIKIKNEEVLLNLIKKRFHIPNKIIVENNGWFILKTTQSRAITNIIKFFSPFNRKFKGMNSFKFNL